jgi:DNA-binding transcriptional ArsR family regulator
MAIFEAFVSLGEASVLEVAERLGGPPTSLYYHVDQLTKEGLLIQTGSRQANTRVEHLYKPASTRLRLDKRDRTKPHREALKASAKNALREAEKDFNDAQETNDAYDPTQMLRVSARLTEEEAEAFKRKLAELGEWLRSNEKPDGKTYSVTAVFTPKREP